MGWITNEQFKDGLSFLKRILSSYDSEDEEGFMSNLSTIEDYVAKYGRGGDCVPYGGILYDYSKAMCLDAVLREYKGLWELKQDLEEGVKLCEQFMEAIDKGTLEAFNVGDLVVTDNGFENEDYKFDGSIESFVEQTIEQNSDYNEYGDEYNGEAAEMSELTVSVEEFVAYLKGEWEYPFEEGEILDFTCVYEAIRAEMDAFLKSHYPNIRLVD